MTQQELQELTEDKYTITDGKIDYELIVYNKGTAFGIGFNSIRCQLSISGDKILVSNHVGGLIMFSDRMPVGFDNLKLKQ